MELDLMTVGGRLTEVQALARRAEQAGLSGLVITEAGRTAYLSAAAAGLAAPGLHLATGVAVAFPRSPMVTAATAWELADLTGGRFRLGLGTQVKAHVERRYAAPFDPPGPRMRDYVLALRAIFRAFRGEERLDHHGEFYDLSLLPPAWSPGPIEHPHVPVDVAAVGPWMLRMAGEVADGVHVHPFHSRRYLDDEVLPGVAEGAARAGRDPAEVALIVPVFTIVGDTDEERAPWRAMARAQIGFYGSTRNYAHMFDRHGFDGTSARLNERLKAGDVAGMSALITDDMLDVYAVTATWEELPGRLAERYGGVASRLVMYLGQAMCQRDPSAWDRWSDVARAVRATGTDG
ncbi:MAG: TIGR03617 family F420-dependent LLM class oxidoreductase [Acidimicrobiales bacterium]|nr:TIGR03617 family F420-dependent LLM class oxidoreductase [Acidimicrobiales bacterium]